MSNYLENCRAYSVKAYEKKSGRYYRFSVIAESKPRAKEIIMEYAEENIGNTFVIKEVTKLPNKPQVLDFSEC